MPFTLQAFKEDALASDMTDSASSLTLVAGAFGTPTGEQMLVIDPDIAAKREIVKCAIDGATVTSVDRAQDGTSAVAHSSGAKVIMAFVPSHYTNIFERIYPIGSIYTNASDDTNPADLLGFGTWEAFGAGKVMVGIDSEDEDFDTAEKTGGAKTSSVAHTHTGPSHAHSLPLGVRFPSGVIRIGYNASGVSGTFSGELRETDSGSVTNTSWDRLISAAGGTGNTGAMSANATPSVVQPYITVYMWKRTA
jgi:hypothetical protein